jgi:luciferase family oxidoreductase group 1
MTPRYTVGVLDLCKLHGEPPDQALWATLELAPLVESLGYSRYWLAEHHTKDVAHSSPEILLPILAGITRRMRIGTAGIMLNLYSPFKVASDFRLLNTIFPDRIDLGIARVRTHSLIEGLLRQPNEPPFEEKVGKMMGFLRGVGETSVNPVGVAPPEVWLLGSRPGSSSLELAAATGTAFCFALFIGQHSASAHRCLADYRARFVPSSELPEPRCSLAFAGVCADTDAKAKEIAASYGPYVMPTLVGSPVAFRSGLRALSETFGTADFIFLNLAQSLPDRVRSYTLVAEALDLCRQ